MRRLTAAALAAGAWAASQAVCAAAPIVAPERSMSMLLIPVEAAADPGDPRLPLEIQARITIRYAARNPGARQHALDLSRGLSEQGLDVGEPVPATERIIANTVGYFYAEDLLGAEIAARGLGPGWRLVQRHITPREALPRPGALELAVAGP